MTNKIIKFFLCFAIGISFAQDNDDGPGGNVVDGFWGGSRYRSDGAENTSSLSSASPNNIRVYGTWSSVHTESGKQTYSKWYAIVNFNENGKIVRFNDWFNVDGLEVQINQ